MLTQLFYSTLLYCKHLSLPVSSVTGARVVERWEAGGVASVVKPSDDVLVMSLGPLHVVLHPLHHLHHEQRVGGHLALVSFV